MNDTQRIEHLKQRLADYDDRASSKLWEKVDLLNELAWLLSDTDMKGAYALAETAHTLATAGASDEPPYQIGIAYSLRTQGYLNVRFDDYPLALTQLLQALPLVEMLSLTDGLADVLDGIFCVYHQLGNLPEALAFGYQQLAAAEQIQDRRRIINAYNNLAVIQMRMENHATADELWQQALQIAKEIGHTRVECITYVNLTQIYLQMGDPEKALKNALCSLQLCQEYGYEFFALYALHNIGYCYLQLKQTDQALDYLNRALEQARRLEAKVIEVSLLLTLGAAYRELQHFEQAEATGHQALTITQAIGSRQEQDSAHLFLAELYEQVGDFAQALAHFKQHQAVKEQIFNEKADERLKVLQVAHDTATAKHQAEIAYLKTVDLQREIAEHWQSRLQLQRQLEYLRTLSEFKLALLASVESEADSRRILAEALHHLLKPTQARMIAIHQNIDDPELGRYSRMLVTATGDVSLSLQSAEIYGAIATEYRAFLTQALPGLSAHGDEFITTVFPQSLIPPLVNRQLMAGTWFGGPIAKVFADAPAFRDFLIQKLNLHVLLIFPIHIDGQWWGTITMVESISQPTRVEADVIDADGGEGSLWTEDKILMFGTATEMIASTIQRWQAQINLRRLNNALEQQIVERTAELSDTVAQLRTEIDERRRAENALQAMTTSLEQRLADRTQELATFFDLTVMGGQSANVHDIIEVALPRILEVTNSRAVCIHLLDADSQELCLIAQQELSLQHRTLLQKVALPPRLRAWLAQPNEPLLTIDLSQSEILPPVFRLAEFKTYLGVQINVGPQIEGILSCYRFTDRGFGLDDIALVMALGEQIGMVIGSHRLRKQAEEFAVMEERQRLARDLHDSLTQSLYSLSLFSRAGREAVEDGDTIRLQHSFSQAETTTLHILRELRLLLYELRPANLAQEGLKRAVELRLDSVERRVGVQVEAQIDEPLHLVPNLEVDLYHIIVEVLNNIIKHAAATYLTLQLTRQNEHLYLDITDNGQGFDPAQPTGGLGLRNIQERVNRYNGTLALVSQPLHGTKVEIVIPSNLSQDSLVAQREQRIFG